MFAFSSSAGDDYLGVSSELFSVSMLTDMMSSIFITLIYGVSLYWVFVILCKVAKNDQIVDGKIKIFKWFKNTTQIMRRHQYVVIITIFSWSILMPLITKMLGIGTIHIRLSNFQVI